MSNDALILDLSSDLAPVRRRSMRREGALVLALCAVEVVLILALGAMRPDMRHMATSPYLTWRVTSLGLLAVVACVLAVRSFSATAQPRRGLALAGVLAGAAAAAGALVTPAGAGTRAFLDRIDPASGIVVNTTFLLKCCSRMGPRRSIVARCWTK